MSLPQGAVVEIIEHRRGEPNGSIGDEIVVPTEIRINGTPMLIPRDFPPKVHEMTVSPSGEDMVLVTITLIAKRVVIGQEWSESAA